MRRECVLSRQARSSFRDLIWLRDDDAMLVGSYTAELRALTQTLHSAVEQRLGNLDPLRSPEHYRLALQAFHGIYTAGEQAIPAYGDAPACWLDADRRKVPWLQEDLADLGLSASQVAALPVAPSYPWRECCPQQDAWWLGCMYVVEGATLGGQYLMKRWAAADLAPAGTRFFRGYGTQTGTLWNAIRMRIEGAAAKGPEASDTILRAAQASFAAFHDWFVVLRL